MRPLILAAVLALLAGCAVEPEPPRPLTEPAFWGLWWEEYCRLDVDCYHWYDLDTCYDSVRVTTDTDIRDHRADRFDADAASAALDEIRGAGCDDVPDVIWAALGAAYGEE